MVSRDVVGMAARVRSDVPRACAGMKVDVMRAAMVGAALFWLWPSVTRAQVYPPYPIPIEGSVGVGALADRSLSGWTSAVAGGFSWDYDPKSWGVLVMEGELSGASEASPCRAAGDDAPSSCGDGALFGGIRFRPAPHASAGVRPFGQLMLGRYWKGSGTEDEEFVSKHFAMQVGGGAEVRWGGSIHGLRMSIDYRRVFAGDRSRNQVRILCAYVIGPRRFTRRTGEDRSGEPSVAEGRHPCQ